MRYEKNYSTFLPTRDSFFDNLVTLIVSLASYEFTTHVGLASNNPKELHERSLAEWKNYIRPLKDVEYTMRLEERSTNKLLLVYTAEILASIYLNNWPHHILYESIGKDVVPLEQKIAGTNYPNIARQMVGAAFVNYYSGQENAIKSRFGTDPKGWAETIRFAWAIRNGFAHGNGRYHIKDQNISLTWKTWTIDHSHNGQLMILDPDGHGLGIGDVIRLMEDVDLILK